MKDPTRPKDPASVSGLDALAEQWLQETAAAMENPIMGDVGAEGVCVWVCVCALTLWGNLFHTKPTNRPPRLCRHRPLSRYQLPPCGMHHYA